MAIEVNLLKQPYEVSFTGNPMPYLFALSPYGDTEKLQDVRLQVRINIEDIFESDFFTEVRNQVFYPDGNGNILVDVKSIIDPYLEFYRPKPTLTNPAQAVKQRKRYKISYLLQVDNAVVGSPTETDILYAIKGGMAYEYWHPSEFFTDTILTKKLPFNYGAKDDKISLDEKRYIFWTYPLANNTDQTIVYKIYFNDGTIYTRSHPKKLAVGKWGICCMPAGFNQSGLDAFVPAGKIPVKYTIEITLDAASGTHLTTEDGTAITNENDLQLIVDDTLSGNASSVVAPFTFTIDHRNFYNAYQLIYRNSLGAFETIRLLGQVDVEADYATQQAQRIVPPSYFSNMNLIPQTIQGDPEETAKYTADTGFISRARAIKLRELFLSTEVYELRKNKFVPVVIITKNTKFFSNRDNLISTQVQWQLAFVNNYFTPDGLLPEGRTCPALQNFLVKQLSKEKLQIMYAMPLPYDRLQVTITTPADTYTFIYTGNGGTVVQPFRSPVSSAPVDITIVAKVMCDEDSTPMDLGPASSVTLSITGDRPPVVNDDTFTIFAGFTTAIPLQGSVLDNDYDPDGEPIECIPDGAITTNAGGLATINKAGKITYQPPPSNFTGTDSFTYYVKNTGAPASYTGGPGTYPGTINIIVKPAAGGGNPSGIVYVKLVTRDVTTVTSGNAATGWNYSNAKVYLVFYRDAAGTIPVDVTGLGLIFNVNQDAQTVGDDNGFADAVLNITGTGTEMKIFDGLIKQIRRNFTQYNQYVFTMLQGTGYTAI